MAVLLTSLCIQNMILALVQGENDNREISLCDEQLLDEPLLEGEYCIL